MATKVHTYEVQKGEGKGVLPRFVGTKVELTDFTTIKEALDGGHFASEASILAAAYRDRHIVANRKVRDALAKDVPGKSDAELIRAAIEAGNAVKIGEPSARATPATAKPKTRQDRAAKDAGNAIFERLQADPEKRRRAFEMGLVDEAAYNAWRSAKVAAAEAAAAPKVAAAPATPAPAAPAQAEPARRPAAATKTTTARSQK